MKKKLNILQITSTLNVGGAEKFCIDLSNQLCKSNNLTICVLSDYSSSPLLKTIDDKVKVFTFNKKLGFKVSLIFKLWIAIKKLNPDIIHTHGTGLFYLFMVVISRKFLIVHTLHNLAIKESHYLIRLFYFIYFFYFNVIPVSISPTVRSSTLECYGSKFNIFINNGITKPSLSKNLPYVQEFIKNIKKNKDTLIFINVARLYPQKNQKLMIDCFNELNNEGYNILLLILGEDTSINSCYGKLLKENAGSNIYFIGQVDNPCDYIFHSDIFILSSLYEGLPLSLLEALSYGKYCVSTPAGGVVDVITKRTVGLLSKDFNLKSFKDTVLNSIYLYKNVKNDLIINFYNNNYSMNICSKNYNKLYSMYV